MKTILYLFQLLCLTPTLLTAQAWNSSGIGGGGALFMPSISPHNPNEFYISCDMTESFRSTNAGTTWSAVDFNQLRAFAETQVQFTSDPNIRYASNSNFEVDGRSLKKSTNGGLTWADVPGDPTGEDVWYVLADPNSTTRLLVSSYNELYFSSNGGISFSLIHSSSDLYIGGAFWDGMNIFVGTRDGLLVSTNNGTSFALNNTGLPANNGFLSFTGAKEGGTTRLFGVVRHKADIYPGIQGSDYDYDQDVYRRDWGVSNWTVSSTGIPAADFPFFVSMSQNDIDVVYASGATQYPSHPSVYKSTNGGATWTAVLNTVNNQNIQTGWMGHGGDRNWGWAECAMGFTVSTNNPNIAIVTDFGFAHLTQDGGATWKQLYSTVSNPAGSPTPTGVPHPSNGLNNTASWWMEWASATEIWTAYTDITGVRSVDSGDSWSFSNSGNAYNSTYQYVKHPANSTLYACVSSVHDMYQSTYLTDARIDGGDGRILFSTNNGSSWSTLHDFDHPVIAMSIDPTNNNIAYASVIHSTLGGIFKTTNLSAGASSTWVKMTNPPRTEGHPFNVKVLNDGSVVCTYSGRRTSAFTQSSGVFYSTDGGTTWSDRSHTGMYYWTKDLTVDPNDATHNTWYVGVFSGWGGPPNGLGGVYKSTNRGVNWTKINSLDRVEQVAVHPTDADVLYVTTEYEGLWKSDNGTAGSPDFAYVSGYAFQHPLRVFFNPYDPADIWITSFGNSLGRAESAILPVELVSWKAVPMDNHVELEWRVATEKDFKNYEVERSTDGHAYTSIAIVQGTGKPVYQYKDEVVERRQAYYYRLKMNDLDGHFSYSGIRQVKLSGDVLAFEVYPNPAKQSTLLSLDVSKAIDAMVLLVDEKGVIVYHKQLAYLPGHYENTLDLTGISSGVYTLQLVVGETVQSKQLVVGQ